MDPEQSMWSNELYEIMRERAQFLFVSGSRSQFEVVTIEDAQKIWSETPTAVFYPPLRISGNIEDILGELGFSGEFSLTVENILLNSITRENYSRDSLYVKEVDLLEKIRKRVMQSATSDKGNKLSDLISSLVPVLSPPKSQKSKPVAVRKPKYLDERIKKLSAGKVLDVSGINKDGLGAKIINMPAAGSDKRYFGNLMIASNNVQAYRIAVSLIKDTTKYKNAIEEAEAFFGGGKPGIKAPQETQEAEDASQEAENLFVIPDEQKYELVVERFVQDISARYRKGLTRKEETQIRDIFKGGLTRSLRREAILQKFANLGLDKKKKVFDERVFEAIDSLSDSFGFDYQERVSGILYAGYCLETGKQLQDKYQVEDDRFEVITPCSGLVKNVGSGSCGLIVLDGYYAFGENGGESLPIKEIRRVLSPDGIVIMRDYSDEDTSDVLFGTFFEIMNMWEYATSKECTGAMGFSKLAENLPGYKPEVLTAFDDNGFIVMKHEGEPRDVLLHEYFSVFRLPDSSYFSVKNEQDFVPQERKYANKFILNLRRNYGIVSTDEKDKVKEIYNMLLSGDSAAVESVQGFYNGNPVPNRILDEKLSGNIQNILAKELPEGSQVRKLAYIGTTNFIGKDIAEKYKIRGNDFMYVDSCGRQEIPAKDFSVDLVIYVAEQQEEITQKTIQRISEIRRVLSPDGVYVTRTYNPASTKYSDAYFTMKDVWDGVFGKTCAKLPTVPDPTSLHSGLWKTNFYTSSETPNLLGAEFSVHTPSDFFKESNSLLGLYSKYPARLSNETKRRFLYNFDMYMDARNSERERITALSAINEMLRNIPRKQAPSSVFSQRANKRVESITNLVQEKSVKKILDIGGGNGEIAEALRKNYGLQKRDVYVLDDKLPRNSGVTKIEYAGDTKIPLNDRSVDLIVFLVVLHHIDPEAREKILKEAYRVLSPKGTLVIREHNHNGTKVFENYISLVHNYWYIVNNEEEDPLFLMTREEATTELGKAGFVPRQQMEEEGDQKIYYASFIKRNY